mmetsp:Transcript_23898/g.43415  ORF Transcript_23898/g.43415 Transcript_23898/m.43415 type:complete len:260 (+) Transcript_23898:1597-2376(+)
MFIATVQVVHPGHTGFTHGGKACEDQTDAGAQVRRHHRRPLEVLDTCYRGRSSMHINLRTHTDQFGGMHEPVLENLLFEDRNPLCRTQKRHHLCLQIRGKARKGSRGHIHGLDPPILARHLQAVRCFRHRDACRIQPFTERSNKVDAPAQQFDLAAAHGGSQHVSAQLDSVGDHAVGRTVQAVHALDGDGAGAIAIDLCAHRAQTGGKVHNLRLTGRVVDHGCALGQGRGHQDVFGRPHAGKRKVDDCPFERAACGFGM